MKYNFDQVVDRSQDHSMKHHGNPIQENPDLMPMWVADMDFAVLPEISQALIDRVHMNVYGYTSAWTSYRQEVAHWMARRHEWIIQEDWILPVPGIVPAIKVIIQACTRPEDRIMICSPVYHPFKAAIEQNNRICVDVGMIGDHFDTLDFEAIEKAMEEENVRMFIFCSPHNPCGRVWHQEELKRIGELCQRYNVLMVSDEIHMDFARRNRHIPFCKANPDWLNNTIVCTAPTKTFNLAGLHVSNLVIANEDIRQRVARQMDQNGLSQPNILGLVACEAAYRFGDEWVDELNAYLEETAIAASEWLKEHFPLIELNVPDGLYLFWLDCRKLNLSDEELQSFMMEEAQVWMNPGVQFGAKGSGFMRLNAATSRENVLKALERMKKAWMARQSTQAKK